MRLRPLALSALVTAAALAQEPAAQPPVFPVPTGTRVPLVMINSVSTKHAAELSEFQSRGGMLKEVKRLGSTFQTLMSQV
jgi:hypothetical protein